MDAKAQPRLLLVLAATARVDVMGGNQEEEDEGEEDMIAGLPDLTALLSSIEPTADDHEDKGWRSAGVQLFQALEPWTLTGTLTGTETGTLTGTLTGTETGTGAKLSMSRLSRLLEQAAQALVSLQVSVSTRDTGSRVIEL